MIYRILADVVLVIHLVFIIFAVAGALAVLRWRFLAWVHLPCALWAIAIEWGGWICPLTPLEIFLRHAAGQAGYTGGFIQHYLVPIIYPRDLTRELQIGLGIGVLVINLAAYALVVRKACTIRRKGP